MINEVFIDLAVHPDRWYDLALFAKVYAFLTIIEITPTSRGFGLQGGALFKFSPSLALNKIGHFSKVFMRLGEKWSNQVRLQANPWHPVLHTLSVPGLF